jgi:myo-inositol-1(or 4)-monophosphatase
VTEIDIARQAARAGADVLRAYFQRGVTARQKSAEAGFNLVTEADVDAERATAAVIRRAFPEHAILGEESHQDDVRAPHLWIIDPLDGTNNFVHRLPHFAISVAYYVDGQAQSGVVGNPIRDDWYEAVRGGGASHNGQPLRVSPATQLDEVLVGTGFYYDRGTMMEQTLKAMRRLFQQHVHGIRRFGTASLDLCLVAAGSFGAFFEYELSPWDFAAGRLVVEEAGGRVTTCGGNPLPLAKTSVLASNGLLHDAALSLVRRGELD